MCAQINSWKWNVCQFIFKYQTAPPPILSTCLIWHLNISPRYGTPEHSVWHLSPCLSALHSCMPTRHQQDCALTWPDFTLGNHHSACPVIFPQMLHMRTEDFWPTMLLPVPKSASPFNQRKSLYHLKCHQLKCHLNQAHVAQLTVQASGDQHLNTDQLSLPPALLFPGFLKAYSHFCLFLLSLPKPSCMHTQGVWVNPSRTWIQHLQQSRGPEIRLRTRDWLPRITLGNRHTRCPAVLPREQAWFWIILQC